MENYAIEVKTIELPISITHNKNGDYMDQSARKG